MRRRIVIVDDDPAFLATVRVLLEEEGFEVVGEALSGVDGVAVASRLNPDIVLVDVNLPDIDGFEVAERLDRQAAAPVVLTSSQAAVDFGTLIETSCARAFVTKDEISAETLAQLADGTAAT